ncbi:MAG: NAD(P)H-hydrate dehydratase, partial [Acholeplasmatales bacterium]|nr:NAD(P)H-hydrate dehydratase [Acholeplasmatales bacterium]
GYVLLIGGSLPYSGAIRLSDMGLIALKCGAGVSTIAIPDSICEYIIPNILESTVYPLSSLNGFIKFNKDEIDKLIKRYKVISIGMGIGNNDETSKLLEYILLNYDKKLIIDADGLNALSNNVELLNKTKAKVVLTPHIKEFSRLIKKDINEILDNEIIYAKDFSLKYNCVLLLKGPTTIICDGFDVYLVNRGTSGMATAGSGDVLSGIITGLLGYIDNISLGVALASYINGLAGELAEKENNAITMTSKDTVNNIKNAYEYILKKLNK